MCFTAKIVFAGLIVIFFRKFVLSVLLLSIFTSVKAGSGDKALELGVGEVRDSSKKQAQSSSEKKKDPEKEESYKKQILEAMEKQGLALENSKAGLLQAAASCLAENNVDRAKSVLVGVGFASEEATNLVERLSGLKIDNTPKAERLRKVKLECEAKLAAQGKEIEELKEKNKKMDKENALLAEKKRKVCEESERIDGEMERVGIELEMLRRRKDKMSEQRASEENLARDGQVGSLGDASAAFVEAAVQANDLDKEFKEQQLQSQEEVGEPRITPDVKSRGINISGLFLGAVFLIGVPLAVVCVKRLLRKRMKPKKKTMILKEIRKQ